MDEAVDETVMEAEDAVVVAIKDKNEVIMKPNVVHNIKDNIFGESVRIIGKAMHIKE